MGRQTTCAPTCAASLYYLFHLRSCACSAWGSNSSSHVSNLLGVTPEQHARRPWYFERFLIGRSSKGRWWVGTFSASILMFLGGPFCFQLICGDSMDVPRYRNGCRTIWNPPGSCRLLRHIIRPTRLDTNLVWPKTAQDSPRQTQDRQS